MDKEAFQVDQQYAITLQDANGKLRPANIYVHHLFDNDMIVRRTDGADTGMLFKIPYSRVTKIVRTVPVMDVKRFMLPKAMLSPKLWESRDSMSAYSSSPNLGK